MTDNEAMIEAALVALIYDPEVPTGVRAHLLGGETVVIRERTDAEPIVRAVLSAFEADRAPYSNEQQSLLGDVQEWLDTLSHAMPATETLVARLASYVRRFPTKGDMLAANLAEFKRYASPEVRP